MSATLDRSAEKRSWLARVLSLRTVRWFELDWHVVVLAALLLTLGIVMVYAISDADVTFDHSNPVSFKNHIQKCLIALPGLFLGLAFRPRWVRLNAHALWAVSTLLLVLVLVMGDARNGSRRWIQLGSFDLQPSEFAKIAVILALARTLDRSKLQDLREWSPPLALALIPMGLVALQPDLGTALTLAPITLGMLYVAGARARTIFVFLGMAALVGVLLWQFELGIRSYQLERVSTWLHGWNATELIGERNGAAFHTYHARVAIGNGGLFGRGIGHGIANETAYLPMRDCDSIFAVVAEELGWIGGSVVLVIYALFVVMLMASAGGLRDRFSRLVVAGVAIYFGAHLFINVGVNLGLVPLTGLTLPFFSTGGSSLLTTFLALGLALGLASHQEPSLDADSFKRR